MRSAFSYSLVICVASVFSQQPFVRYSENLRKAVPHHYNHDQKNTDRGVDKVARGHKIEPHQPPLRPQPAVPWLRWVHEGRWAAQADKNTELHRVRARLLEEKLKPNQFAFKPRINPQLKPKLSQKEKARIKREAEKTKVVKIQKETGVKENVRHKREAPMSQLVPDIIMQPHMDAKIPQPMDQFAGRVEEPKKRKKRQILYFINKPPQLLARSPRTTPNPFIRDTHIDEYDIIRPEVGEREGMIPTVEEGSSDPGSYPLVSETSDLEYESDYTFSMSDSEEWHNYPLTTPSGPNPGWQLSTLADIYQKQRRSRTQILTPEKMSHGIKTVFRVWPVDGDQTLIRAKRSPKQNKRRIGAYKEKLKQRRKVKDMKKKRRIIRNSKEDKAVKEDLKDEKYIQRLLERPKVFQRQTAYQVEEASKEILWSNGTHNIVEDKDATVKWINETHYVVYKDKDNSTEEWYHQHHILCFNEEWDNKTSEEKRNATIGAQEEDEDDEDLKVKEAEKVKPGGKAFKKKAEKRRKGQKGVADKKAVKPKIKSKQSKKIMTAKNVNEEPKDPRKDPREWKTVKKSLGSSEEAVKNKKDKKVKTDDEEDTSKSKKKKKRKDKKVKTDNKEDISTSKEKKMKKDKQSKRDSEKDEVDSSKKRKRKKSKTDDQDGKDSPSEKKQKKKKDKIVKNSQKENDSDTKSKTEREKKNDTEKKDKKKVVKSDRSSEADVKKKKKEKKTKDKVDGRKKDEGKTRKKRSIYRSDESKTTEVRWEKVQKSEYDGWTVLGGEEDQSQVYDASYELIETRNITKNSH